MERNPSDLARGLGHEPVGANARIIGISLTVFFAALMVSLILVAALSAYFSARYRTGPSAATPLPSNAVPPLDARQAEELRDLRAQEQKRLSEYGWVDQDAGVARIPVSRAIEILAREANDAPSQLPKHDAAINENRDE